MFAYVSLLAAPQRQWFPESQHLQDWPWGEAHRATVGIEVKGIFGIWVDLWLEVWTKLVGKELLLRGDSS